MQIVPLKTALEWNLLNNERGEMKNAPGSKPKTTHQKTPAAAKAAVIIVRAHTYGSYVSK